MAARKIVCADPSLTYTSMLLGRLATNKQPLTYGKRSFIHTTTWATGHKVRGAKFQAKLRLIVITPLSNTAKKKKKKKKKERERPKYLFVLV